MSISHLISRVSIEFSNPLWRRLCLFSQCCPLLPACTGMLWICQCWQAGMRFLGNKTCTWHPTQILTCSVFLNFIKSQTPAFSRLGSLPGYLSTCFSSILTYWGKKSAKSGLSFIAFIFNVILYYEGNVLALWSGEERQSYFRFKMETKTSKMSLAKHKHVFCNLSIDSLGSNLKLTSSINDQCNSNVPSKVWHSATADALSL